MSALALILAAIPIAIQQPIVPKDESLIRAQIMKMQNGWNNKSGAGFAEPFAQDADYVVVDGMYLKGKHVIAGGHQGIFDSIYKDVDLSLEVERIRFLRPDIAIAHAAAQTFHKETKAPLAKARITMTFARQSGQWLIEAFHNTEQKVASDAPDKPNMDRSAVHSAVLDYVEGIYNVQPERIDRSVSKDLVKRGFWYDPKKKEYTPLLPMTFDQLRNLAANWNKDGKSAGPNSPKKIEIYEVQDKSATAKLTAEWGTDYFHLAKIDGKWTILNIIWQSPMP